jgi:integrase
MASRRLRLSEASARYEAHCTARGLAPKTITGQQVSLRIMQRTIGDLMLDSITSQHVDRLFNTHSWAPGTRNNRIGQYKAFFGWCRSNKFMNPMLDPMTGWRQRTVPEKHHLRIPHAEWPRLFNACQHPQERIVIATGLYLFLRASEQQDLRIADVKLSENIIQLWRRKTQTTQVMPVSAELGVEVRRWLTYLSERHELQGHHHFICARNKDLHTDPVTRLWVAGSGTLNLDRPVHKPHLIVQRVLRRAGYTVEKGQGEHTLRRSGARAYFDHLVSSGYDGSLRQVQTLLGHSNAVTTERYLGITLDQRRVLEALAGKPMFSVGENILPIRSESYG